MKNKFLIFAGLLIILSSFVSAQYSDFYNLSPSELLENEWVVFAGVFLIVFAMVFMALSKQFSSKKKNSMYPWMTDTDRNKAVPGIIALVIALFSAAAFVRNNLIERIFGEAITIWILVLVLIVLFMLSVPFYKALKQNVGGGIAISIIVVGLWAIIKFGFDPFQYNLPSGFYDFYEIIINPVFLVVLVVAGVIFSLIKRSSRGR
ncbi:hypothetical protein CMI44_02530 [Candidatus Pacearchaeota archaeon]|nr:hypothetical protein [Candidatus Pacearchaeota archaeon]|tara:strand:+ start:1754 stop:2368 length:615 start_codon:yes stop_codon:yes gene_type:complete